MAVKVTIANNGPILVAGEFELFDAEGKPYGLAGRTSVALCRCGHSQNKPFCDGSHKNCNFQSVVQAHDLPALRPKE